VLASPCVPSLCRDFKLTGPEPPDSFTSYVFVLGSKSFGPRMDLLHYIPVLRWHCGIGEKSCVLYAHRERGLMASFFVSLARSTTAVVSLNLWAFTRDSPWPSVISVAKACRKITGSSYYCAHISRFRLDCVDYFAMRSISDENSQWLRIVRCQLQYMPDEHNQSLYRFDQFKGKRIVFFLASFSYHMRPSWR